MYILQSNLKFMLRLDSKAYIESDSVVCQYLACKSLLLPSLLRESFLKIGRLLHSLLGLEMTNSKNSREVERQAKILDRHVREKTASGW